MPRRFLDLRYYLKATIEWCADRWGSITRGITNHQQLVDAAAKWSHDSQKTVAYVTFNYDRLLEDALDSVLGRRLVTPGGYVEDEAIRVFKVHGSIDWLRQVSNVASNNKAEILASAATLHWTESYGSPAGGLAEAAGHAWVPAIAVPTLGKSSFECPKPHIEILKGLLPRVEKLLIIGWRGAEQHFMELWRQPGGSTVDHLHIVEGSNDGIAAVRANLHELAGVSEKGNGATADGFSSFVTSGAMRDFLA